eukprot:13239812-Alexandrium_andersonii.AAC.1
MRGCMEPFKDAVDELRDKVAKSSKATRSSKDRAGSASSQPKRKVPQTLDIAAVRNLMPSSAYRVSDDTSNG